MKCGCFYLVNLWFGLKTKCPGTICQGIDYERWTVDDGVYSQNHGYESLRLETCEFLENRDTHKKFIPDVYGATQVY
jgi:hypothetical protein